MWKEDHLSLTPNDISSLGQLQMPWLENPRTKLMGVFEVPNEVRVANRMRKIPGRVASPYNTPEPSRA